MAASTREFLKASVRQTWCGLQDGWRAMLDRGPGQIQFWFIALIIGIAAGFAALGFRKAIVALQTIVYGTDDVMLASHAQGLPWYWVLGVPIVGGLIVGLILHHFTPDGRSRAVADVINGAALHEGRVELRAGLASAAASIVTLSTGGSSGREGPVVHLGAMISTAVSRLINANGITGRDLLGCAVAAAVSASFNTPIAGALFALEVVLRHFAVHAFAPIVIASVAGTVVSRLEFGNVTEFYLPAENVLEFYVELPAFVLLGLLCGVVAVLLMRSIFWAEDMGDHLQASLHVPGWLRPAIAGGMLGAIAIMFPHIIGVGYETTSAALTGNLVFWGAVSFAVVKVVAVVITLAGRMGGGIFSPSLMLGSLTGLAFGLAATSIFPEVSGSETLYALAGMGAVAAAVLGAPISTTLIVFELTGDWQTGLAVMVAVSMSTALASRLVDKSFFLTQLERRNVHLAAGPQAYLLATFGVAKVMRACGVENAASDEKCWELVGQGVYLDGNATLETAMPMFENARLDFIPVVTLGGEDAPPELWGALFQVDALRAFNKALADTAEEEHS
ncbi:MAG: CIC family chloride channel protein [Paracoccaceae bacterium]